MHLAIIMDGNRRWAKERGLPGFEGHKKGAQKIRQIVKHCKRLGIDVLTLYAFSTENWNRSPQEVSFLMDLFGIFLVKELKEFQKNKIKVRVIGQRERLPSYLQKRIKKTEDLTKKNDGLTLILAISYSGWSEMVEAVRQIVKEGIPPEKIDQGLIKKYLWTADMPDADLIIRTSGEQRVSDFLTWEASYAELYFYRKYWPDFSEQGLDEALAEYAKRQRRFGK